jgi:hypothetical protein
MAGAGYKLFNTGDVLTAAQVNTYLQEQAVMRFASAAARTTALSGVLAEGMVSYLDDVNQVQVYNGSSWVAVGGSSPLTTKGDVYTYSTADARLAVGTNGQYLSADSTTATGLKWVTPAGSTKSFSLLNSGGTSLTGSNNITISSISGQDALWVVVVNASSANASSTIGVRFNSDTGTNYRQAGMQNETANPLNYNIVNIFGGDEDRISLGLMSTSTSSRICGSVSVWGATSTNPKAYVSTGGGEGAGATYTHRSYVGQGMYLGTSAISSVTINSSTGNFDNGTVYVYGSA